MNTILHHIDHRGIATLTLNRPQSHNAFDDKLIADLTAHLTQCGADPKVRAVVLRGTGKSFSAGADLEWMRRMADYGLPENVRDAEALATLMQTLDRLPKPTIGVVQGAAYGGGVGLVACLDIVIASPKASFCLSEVKLGLIPAVISPYVVNAIGLRHARRYALTAEIITATRAHEIGLVHALVPEDALEATLETMLKALLQGGPQAQAEAKDLLFLVAQQDQTPALISETARRIAVRRASAEGREGIGAFLAKRKPAWQQE